MSTQPLKSKFLSLIVALALASGCADPVKPSPDIASIREQVAVLDRGRYVVEIMGCNDCHTPDYLVKRSNVAEEEWLVGNTLGFIGSNGTAYPTNLRLLIDTVTEEEWLVRAKQMRKDTPMADVMLPNTLDQDLRAIYRFIKYLGPKGVPAPARLPKGVMPTTQFIVSPAPH